ncbi:MAG: hypothetical protein R3E66_11090 [bacterium]
MKWLIAMMFLWSSTGFAQSSELSSQLPSQPDVQEAAPVQPSVSPSELGAYEAQIGLKLFDEGDDYRAVTALKRFRILDPRGEFIASLIIGEIYRRNVKPEQAVGEFGRAESAAPDQESRLWSGIVKNATMCVPLSYYLVCARGLRELAKQPLSARQRDLVAYQQLYTDVVLRQPIDGTRANVLSDAELKKHALAVIAADAAFDELGTKSPALAGVLSGVLPGAGQLYNGRPIDAVIGFVLVGLSAAGTWYAWEELDSIPVTVLGGAITLGFYSGTIVNAVVDAHRINAELYRQFFKDLQAEHWPKTGFDVRGNKVEFGWTFAF